MKCPSCGKGEMLECTFGAYCSRAYEKHDPCSFDMGLQSKPMLRMVVIYENTKDYPGRFVVREWLIGEGVLVPKQIPLAVTPTGT